MNKSVQALAQLIGIILIGIGLYGMLSHLLDTGSLSLGTPAICLCLGGCSWGLSFALGHSLSQDQALCESQEENDEKAAEEGD